MAVEASIIVEFGKGVAAGSVIIELDGKHPNNLDSSGKAKTSFNTGDKPVFLIQYDPAKVKISSVKSTNGDTARLGLNIARSRKMSLLFTTLSTKVGLSYTGVSSASYTWFGNTGRVSIANNSFVISGGTLPCYCEATYNVDFQEQWQLNPPILDLAADETYTIYVVVYVEVI